MKKTVLWILLLVMVLSAFPMGGNAETEFQALTPHLRSVSADAFGVVSLEWDAVDGAEQYGVYRKKTDDSEWTRILLTDKTSYRNYTAVCGTEYQYTIRAFRGTEYTRRDDVGRSITPQSKVLSFSSVQNVGLSAIGLTWQKLSGNVTYVISRREVGGAWKQVQTLSNTTAWTDKSVENGKTYDYRIVARKTVDGRSFQTATDSVGTRIECNNHATVKLGTVTQGLNAATITWQAMTGAECYYVYRRVSGGEWSYLATTTATSYTDTTEQNGNAYFYTVRAINRTKNIYSYRDTTGARAYATVRKSPALVGAQNTGLEAVTVTWKKLPGAQSYRVYRKTSGGSYTLLKSGLTGTSYTDESVKNGVTYTYTVRGYREQNGKSVFSYCDADGLTVKTAPAGRVAIKTVERGLLSAKLTWSALAGAQGYRVYRKESGGSWKRITGVISKTTYTDSTQERGKTYYYSVSAVKQTSAGMLYTDYDKTGTRAAATVPDSVAMQSAKTTGFRRVKVTWRAVLGADGYAVYRRTANGEWQWLKNVTEAQITDCTPRPNQTYSYTVRAYCVKNGTKIWSGRDTSGISVKLTSTIDPNKPMVAITYDDGPGPYTEQILNVLEKYNAHATFFVVGKNAVSRKSTLSRAAALGCEIGNHTYTHISLVSSQKNTVTNEIAKTDSVIEAATGLPVTLIRPPYGSQNASVRARIDKAFIMWSVDTRDWEHRSSAKTLASVKNNVRDGSVILMHDIHQSTANAAESIVSYLTKKGYQLVTVSELAYYRGYTLKNGTSYRNFY